VSLNSRPLRILTWHVHGNYLYYLTQAPHQFFLPVGRHGPGYAGRAAGFPWTDNVRDVPADAVRDLDVDLILFQSRRNYEVDQYAILSARQRALPRIYLEHDPPQEHPTNTRHIFDDPAMLLVHVTPFNELMWDSGRTPTRVIEHGVLVPGDAWYTGELERGVVVVNGLSRRGRRLGSDVFDVVRREVPLDLIGMESEMLGGVGEIAHDELPAFLCRYRFFFNPIRYTSLGLAVCEAMSLGLPIVGLATTEMATTVVNGVSGYVDTNVRALIDRMHALLRSRELARRLGDGAKRAAHARFEIGRFAQEWNRIFREAAERGRPGDTARPRGIALPATVAGGMG